MVAMGGCYGWLLIGALQSDGVTDLRLQAALPANKDQPPQKPVLAQATVMVLEGTAASTFFSIFFDDYFSKN